MQLKKNMKYDGDYNRNLVKISCGECNLKLTLNALTL